MVNPVDLHKLFCRPAAIQGGDASTPVHGPTYMNGKIEEKKLN